MKNIKVGDLVKCIDDTGWCSLTKNKNYEVKGCNRSAVLIIDDGGIEQTYSKGRFRVAGRSLQIEDDSITRFKPLIPTYERDYLTGKININTPRLPDIDLKELSQNLYKGVQREMKLYSIKKLHKDIKNIYFNEKKRTTVIVFKNGDKAKATSSKDTPFSEYAGFVTALFKYEKGLKLKDVEHLIKKKRK